MQHPGQFSALVGYTVKSSVQGMTIYFLSQML